MPQIMDSSKLKLGLAQIRNNIFFCIILVLKILMFWTLHSFFSHKNMVYKNVYAKIVKKTNKNILKALKVGCS